MATLNRSSRKLANSESEFAAYAAAAMFSPGVTTITVDSTKSPTPSREFSDVWSDQSPVTASRPISDAALVHVLCQNSPAPWLIDSEQLRFSLVGCPQVEKSGLASSISAVIVCGGAAHTRVNSPWMAVAHVVAAREMRSMSWLYSDSIALFLSIAGPCSFQSIVVLAFGSALVPIRFAGIPMGP